MRGSINVLRRLNATPALGISSVAESGSTFVSREETGPETLVEGSVVSASASVRSSTGQPFSVIPSTPPLGWQYCSERLVDVLG